LTGDVPEETRKLKARDIMNRDVVSLNKIESVPKIYEILSTNTHNAFPVVNDDNQLEGIISRNVLITLIKKGAFK
jgi:CBS-domain-containing membrane protein